MVNDMKYRKTHLEGRIHFVVPVVLIVEGVLNGSNGAIFYPADQIARSASNWNGRPIVKNHPAFGNGIANAPEVFNLQRVGILFNVTFDGSRLVGEAWIDAQRANTVDQRIMNAILDGRMLEVSTGLSLDQIDAFGVFNGVEHHYIGENFQPDHLAILPDQIGACSIKDGCGLIRNEEMLVA